MALIKTKIAWLETPSSFGWTKVKGERSDLLDVLDSVCGFHFESDRLAGEGLDEYLHFDQTLNK